MLEVTVYRLKLWVYKAILIDLMVPQQQGISLNQLHNYNTHRGVFAKWYWKDGQLDCEASVVLRADH
jgi:hypothetical protein